MRTARICFAVIFLSFFASSMFAQSTIVGAATIPAQSAAQCQEPALPNANPTRFAALV